MLSMINIIQQYKDNKKGFLEYLRKLKKEELIKLHEEIRSYKDSYTYEKIANETIITLIDINLTYIINQKNVSNVVKEFTYKGKMPKYNEKKVSEIAKQLDGEGKY